MASKSSDQQTRFFEGSVAKINRDGDEVISDHVEPGERLKADVERETREAAKEAGSDKTRTGRVGDQPSGEVKTVTEDDPAKAKK